MKQFERVVLVLFIITLFLNDIESKYGYINNSLKDKEYLYPTDDITSQHIRDNIYHYASVLMKHSNLKVKKINNGILPEGYSEEMRAKAFKIHSNKKNWESTMNYPTEIWGFCIYPKYKINSMTWCDQIYAIKNKEKIIDCKNSFCNVCCDQFPILLRSLSEGKIGKRLMLNKASGNTRINRVATDSEIDQCRNECHRVYPVKKPSILPTPPRDTNLGKSSGNAAKSCSDIKKWGDENSKSGVYWLDIGSKGKVTVYCDMTTDHGGWTLFFNYFHKPSQEVSINSSRLPVTLTDNSHINLIDIGIEESNIKELRFMCTEQSKYNYFMHFKINSKEIIRTAFTGDQSFLKSSSFTSSDSVYTDLQLQDSKSWIRVFDKDNISQIDTVGISKYGGFWNTPFGDSSRKKFWTVNEGQFECGTFHKDLMDGTEASLINSHHSIWFRGPPPSEDDARVRYTARNFSK